MRHVTRSARWAFALMGLLLVACGGSSSSGGGGTLPTGSLLVQGQVVAITGDPVAGIAVSVAGRAPVITGTDGLFTFADVPETYDALVIDGSQGEAQLYLGLTRADPTFSVVAGFLSGPPPITGGSIDGTVIGGVGYPLPPSHDSEVTITFDGAFGLADAVPSPGTGDYSASNVFWFGPATTTAQIFAFQWSEDAMGDLIAYTGFGRLDVPMSQGDTLIGQNVALGPVATQAVAGTVTSPVPSVFTAVTALLDPGSGFPFTTPSNTDESGASFGIRMPGVPGGTTTLFAVGFDFLSGATLFTARRDVPIPAAGVSVVLPESVVPALPVDGVTGIGYGDLFDASPGPADVARTFTFEPDAMSMGPTIQVYTMGDTVALPDLTAFGLGIPAGATYTWEVDTIGPVPRLDALLEPPSIILFFPFPDLGPEIRSTSSPERTFVFGP